jgi:hypothetical protein
METGCVKIRLRPGSLERVREWAAEINGRRDEVLATLADERVVAESAFLGKDGDGDFLIYYMKAESLEGAMETFRKSTHAIDEYHRRFQQDTFGEWETLELLIDFDRPES